MADRAGGRTGPPAQARRGRRARTRRRAHGHLLTHPDTPTLERAGLWLIAGGGLGNLWDRLAYGFVIDFIRLDFVRFAVFNPADVFVCVGAGLVVLSVILAEWRKAHG